MAESNAADEELADLFASDEPVDVAVGKHVFKVRHFGLRDILVAQRALRIAHAAMFDDDDAESMLAANIDQVAPVIASATGLAVETVAKLRADVQLQLFGAVLHVNRGFFVQCFAMKFGEGAKLVLEMAAGLAAGPSPSSP